MFSKVPGKSDLLRMKIFLSCLYKSSVRFKSPKFSNCDLCHYALMVFPRTIHGEKTIYFKICGKRRFWYFNMSVYF